MWMNQMEQNRCDWADNDQKLKLRRALVWHTTSGIIVMAIATSKGSGKKTGSSDTAYNAAAKPGTKMCKAFNANRIILRCMKT